MAQSHLSLQSFVTASEESISLSPLTLKEIKDHISYFSSNDINGKAGIRAPAPEHAGRWYFYLAEGCSIAAKSTAAFPEDVVKVSVQVTITEQVEEINTSGTTGMYTTFGCLELRKRSRPSRVYQQLRLISTRNVLVYILTDPWCMYSWLNHGGPVRDVSLRRLAECEPKSCWIFEYFDRNALPLSKWASFHNLGGRRLDDPMGNLRRLKMLQR
jgi:hypothetical protein